jgi:hypothetical protein
VYGEQLAFFPELFEYRNILTLDQVIPGGLTGEKVAMADVWSYLSRMDGGEEGIVSSARTDNQKARLYVEGDAVPRGMIEQGMYVRDDGELYTFVKDNGYTLEGGFHRYSLQLVTGPTDAQKPRRNVNLGQGQFQ